MIRSCRCTHLESAHAGGCHYCGCEQFKELASEHTARLRDLAETGLAIAKEDLEKTGSVNPFFVVYDAAGESHQINVPEQFKDLMNDGPAKALIFGTLRQIAHKMEATAVVIVTDGYFGKPSAKARAMGPKMFEAMRGLGMDAARKAGLVDRVEALLITVQTPERVLTLGQLYERDQRRQKIKYLEINILEGDVDHFFGRQKMFGDLRAENIT